MQHAGFITELIDAAPQVSLALDTWQVASWTWQHYHKLERVFTEASSPMIRNPPRHSSAESDLPQRPAIPYRGTTICKLAQIIRTVVDQ